MNVPEGNEETIEMEEEMMTEEEVIDTTEVETTWSGATVLTLLGVHQALEIEEVAEICRIIRMVVDHQEITMVIVISHATMIDTAIMNLEATEGKGKLISILYS